MNDNQENNILRQKALLHNTLNDIMKIAAQLYEDCVPTEATPKLLSQEFISIRDKLLWENNSNHIRTGFADLDRRIGSLSKGEMIICGSPPDMGGTTFLVQLALNLMKTDNHILFISPCMSNEAISVRFLGALTSIRYDHISARINEENLAKIQDSIKGFDKMPLYIDDSTTSIFNLKRKCENQKLKGKFDVLMIDCLEMIEGTGNVNREIELKMICRTLKSLAQEFNICVIVGAKMKLSDDVKNNFYPLIDDLISLRAFEYEANKILLLYSAERYKVFEDENGNHLEDILEIVIAKNNVGYLGGIPLRFESRSMKISSIDDYCVLDEQEEANSIDQHENPF